jgi:ATP-dependent RNA helicase DeaD
LKDVEMAAISVAQRTDSFTDLGLIPPLLAALAALGYEEPTPIQREAIPPLLAGRDVLGQAATGTGKTAAFALPLLQRLAPKIQEASKPVALVLVPTRELSMQVAEAIHGYGRALGARVLPIYGGQAFAQQLRMLRRGVDVVVATPGRALDHLRRGTLTFDAVEVVVLDEADEMLDMGFAEDLEALLKATPAQRQSALFSATIPAHIAKLAARHLKDPVRISIVGEPAAPGEIPRVRHVAYLVPQAHKPAALGRILDVESPTSAMVFCRTRTEVDRLTEIMNGRGYQAEALHGGLSQEQRERVLRRFRAGTTDLLIATDVAARGLDIEQVSHVINFDVPCAPDRYVHRIGRTGRAGRGGMAVTLAEPREYRQLREIERAIKRKIELATVPTVAELYARRLELTRVSLREAVLAGDLEQYRRVVEALGTEFDMMDIAAAAVKLAHQVGGPDEESDIPTLRLPDRRGERQTGKGRLQPGRAETRSGRRQPAHGPKTAGRRERGWRGMARLRINAGRQAGILPGDLVGAIANEAGISSRAIGAIDIADRYSLVEVANEVADQVSKALRRSTLKGKKVTVQQLEEP